jgi:hypothetical protein
MAIGPVQLVTFAPVIICLALAAALSIYRRHNRTYPGFGYWILGIAFCAVAFSVGIILREIIPLAVSVLLGNVLAVVGLVLLLEGVQRFGRGAPLHRGYYLVPLATFVGLAVSLALGDHAPQRGVIVSLALVGVTGRIVWVMWTAPIGQRSLQRWIAVGFVGVLVVAGVRAGLWASGPSSRLLDPTPLQIVPLLFYLGLLAFFGLAFLMMNARRVEQQLEATESNLRGSIGELERAHGEVEALSGLLPICASCHAIRDDAGYWHRVEQYFSARAPLTFSHGVCPPCYEKHYGHLGGSDAGDDGDDED